jgi:hypothetical protein
VPLLEKVATVSRALQLHERALRRRSVTMTATLRDPLIASWSRSPNISLQSFNVSIVNTAGIVKHQLNFVHFRYNVQYKCNFVNLGYPLQTIIIILSDIIRNCLFSEIERIRLVLIRIVTDLCRYWNDIFSKPQVLNSAGLHHVNPIALVEHGFEHIQLQA